MSYTVSVSTTYRIGCPDCTAEAERIAVQGIRDKSVTCITLRAALKCEHGTEAQPNPQPSLLGPSGSDSAPLLPGLDTPHSDTNGFDTGEGWQ